MFSIIAVPVTWELVLSNSRVFSLIAGLTSKISYQYWYHDNLRLSYRHHIVFGKSDVDPTLKCTHKLNTNSELQFVCTSALERYAQDKVPTATINQAGKPRFFINALGFGFIGFNISRPDWKLQPRSTKNIPWHLSPHDSVSQVQTVQDYKHCSN